MPYKQKKGYMKTNKNGFTLIQLLLIISVTCILAALILPPLAKEIQQTNQRKLAEKAAEAAKSHAEEAKTFYAPRKIGHGVWYFDKVGMDYAVALANFRGLHSNLVVTSQSDEVARTNQVPNDWRGDYGVTVGHVVTTEQRSNLGPNLED